MMANHHENTTVVVFAGPSLPRDAADSAIGFNWRPPAAQGHIIKAVLETRPRAIALIDGVFQSEPAVRHKEILWALSRGILVFGAASMGALRAAELSRFGMIGVGFVYRWYRLCQLAPDDAVAVTHSPVELGCQALSDALIDIRLTLRRARRAGLLSHAQEAYLSGTAHSQHYTERSLHALIAGAKISGIASIPSELACYARSQKRLDAEQLICLLETYRKSGIWPVARSVPAFMVTDAFADDLYHAGIPTDLIRAVCFDFGWEGGKS
jgi:hypothetical protein